MIYTPNYFKPKSNEQIKDFVQSNSFGTLISVLESGELQVSKTPFKLIEEADNWILEGHLAFNNPHLETLKVNKTVTIMFDGAHGYISPTNYNKPEKSVPTWNYSTALIKGQVEVIDDPEWLIKFVSNLSEDYEKDGTWLTQVEKNYLYNLGKRATGIRVKVDSVEAKFKLNQQTPKEERDALIEKVSISNPKLGKDMKESEKWND